MESAHYINKSPDLNAIFSALADPTRRAILKRLSDGKATVMDIAQPFEMSQPAVSRHLKVLEQAGLIAREIDQQRRPARLRPETMAAAAAWLDEFRAFWDGSLDQLDAVLADLTAKTERNEDD